MSPLCKFYAGVKAHDRHAFSVRNSKLQGADPLAFGCAQLHASFMCCLFMQLPPNCRTSMHAIAFRVRTAAMSLNLRWLDAYSSKCLLHQALAVSVQDRMLVLGVTGLLHVTGASGTSKQCWQHAAAHCSPAAEPGGGYRLGLLAAAAPPPQGLPSHCPQDQQQGHGNSFQCLAGPQCTVEQGSSTVQTGAGQSIAAMLWSLGVSICCVLCTRPCTAC